MRYKYPYSKGLRLKKSSPLLWNVLENISDTKRSRPWWWPLEHKKGGEPCNCRKLRFGFHMELRSLSLHKAHPTSKLNSKTVTVLPSLAPSPIFHFHLIPSPVHPTGFSFCFIPGRRKLNISLLYNPSSNNIVVQITNNLTLLSSNYDNN